MVTIFTNSRPFKGPFDTIQRNAIKSWLLLKPECEIILFEDEEKTTEKVAKEFGIKCITDVKCDEFGTPLLSDVFAKTKNVAKYDIIAQVNTDIILMNDFVEGIKRADEWTKHKPFFMVGRRYDLDVTKNLEFDGGWEEKIKNEAKTHGTLHGMAGMDYWVFRKDYDFDPPDFVVGRTGMDSWLIYKARKTKIPVIDATESIFIIHQNHNYPRKKDDFFSIETERNHKLAGALNLMTMRDANWIMTKTEMKKPPFPKNIFSILSLFYPWRMLLALRRKIKKSI